MDTSIRPKTIAEMADAAARRSVETGVIEHNLFEEGTADHLEWKKRYEISLLRLSSPDESDGGA